MPTHPPQRYDSAQPKNYPDLRAAGDFNAIAALYYDLYDKLIASKEAFAEVGILPLDDGGAPDWKTTKLDAITTPADDAGPADLAEVERWCIVVSEIDACANETAFVLWFAPEDGSILFNVARGPERDRDIGERVIARALEAELVTTARTACNDNNPTATPVDLWARYASPPLPAGLLPAVLEDYARAQGELMGVDPGGVAAAALAVCAAVIRDGIKLQVKAHDPQWCESARIWVALIGEPSTKKSPIISAVTEPLKAIDKELFRAFAEARAEYDALPPEEKKRTRPPRNTRMRLEDTTIEAAQEVLKDSPDGLLCLQDELSGWFGSMDKYGSAKGAAKDRGFWLQSFNGGSYVVNRVGRGASMIDNLSVSMLGGIQPGPIRKVAAESVDDGLLQRLFPIVLSRSVVGKDVPPPPAVSHYRRLIADLHAMTSAASAGSGNLANHLAVPMRFDPAAQAIRNELEAKHNAMTDFELINQKLAAHIGKLDGLFARLCIIWQCVENVDAGRPPAVVPESVALRVRDFLHEFLFPHAFAFYSDILGLSDRHDALLATAGHILARKPPEVTVRTLQRGDRMMKTVQGQEALAILEQLEAFGWIVPQTPIRNQTSQRWRVRASVYAIFAAKAREEETRRACVREMIAAMSRAA